MSHNTITSGGVVFKGNANQTQANEPAASGMPLHILILADISGRQSRGEDTADTLSSRTPRAIDRDNFDEIFAASKVRLKTPLSEDIIHFNDIDDLHPDYLYENLPQFAGFRALERKLKKPETFQDAAEEIRQWSGMAVRPESEASINKEVSIDEQAGSLLDHILTDADDKTADISEQGGISNLIKDIVAPYVEKKASPELNSMLTAVNQATSELLRKFMHDARFQSLESTWRSLDLLVRRIETNRTLKLFFVDTHKDELITDLEAHEDISQSATYALLSKDSHVAGGTPFGLVLGDFTISDSAEDLILCHSLASMAASVGSSIICGGDPTLAGCDNLADTQGIDDWQYARDSHISEAWQVLQARPEATHIALAAPRFMLRLPYGKSTSPIETFPFEELPGEYPHEYYLWGNSAYLVTLLIAESYQAAGWQLVPGSRQKVENLPLHVYRIDMDEAIKPCAEIMITDPMTQQFADNGLLSVRSINASNAILIPNFRSVAKTGKWLGFWK